MNKKDKKMYATAIILGGVFGLAHSRVWLPKKENIKRRSTKKKNSKKEKSSEKRILKNLKILF